MGRPPLLLQVAAVLVACCQLVFVLSCAFLLEKVEGAPSEVALHLRFLHLLLVEFHVGHRGRTCDGLSRVRKELIELSWTAIRSRELVVW